MTLEWRLLMAPSFEATIQYWSLMLHWPYMFSKYQTDNTQISNGYFNPLLKVHMVFKHEYLRSRAYIRLSLSSPFSSSSVTVIQIWPLSRYSCFYLGSLHPRNFDYKRCLSLLTLCSLLCKWKHVSYSIKGTCRSFV